MNRTLRFAIIVSAFMVGGASPLIAKDNKPAAEPAKPGASTKPASTAADKEKKKRSRPFVRLSYVPGSAALPVLVGIERGFFVRQGLTVSAVPVIDQRAVTNSLVGGYTDFVAGSQSWLLDLAHAKAPVKVVALSGYGREVEVIVPSWEKKTNSVKDLKDKNVLIVRGTHNFDVVPEFYRVLAFSRMPLTSVNIGFIDLEQLRLVLDPKFQKTFKQRKVGAIVTYREYSKPYVEKGMARVIMNNDQVTKLIGRLSPRPLLVNAAFAERDPAAVQRFVNAWVAIMDYMTKNPKDAARILSIYYARQYGTALKLEDAEALVKLTQYDRVEWTANDTSAANINAKAISAARDILFATVKKKEDRPFKTAPKIDSYIEGRFVGEAQKVLAAKPSDPSETRQDAASSSKK